MQGKECHGECQDAFFTVQKSHTHAVQSLVHIKPSQKSLTSQENWSSLGSFLLLVAFTVSLLVALGTIHIVNGGRCHGEKVCQVAITTMEMGPTGRWKWVVEEIMRL
jgi:hypothetical protein